MGTLLIRNRMYGGKFDPLRVGGVTAFSPADITGIAHWWRGTDVTTTPADISAWADLVGADDQVQATSSKRAEYSATLPTLGQPGGIALVADVVEYRATPLAALLAQPFSVVVAFAFNSLPGTFSPIIGGAGGGGGSWFLRRNGDALQFRAGLTSPSTTGHTNAIDTAYTAIAVFNGTSSKIRVNGVSRYSGADDVGSASCGAVFLLSDASINAMDGEIAEAMIISGDVTTGGQLADLETYLAARYL